MPFDCLEFAARFRCADVAAEVAFLAMDLDHHGRADLAGAFVEAYVRASGDADLPRLLDFYACYRAYVRGKVLGLRLRQDSLARNDACQVAEEAGAYFELARAYAERAAHPRPPLLAAVLGPPASGKTTVARALAGRLGLVHLSSDVVRKELAGLPPTEPCAAPYGKGPYSAEMTRRTYATLLERAGRWLRRGRPVVLDATFGRPAAAGRAPAARAAVPRPPGGAGVPRRRGADPGPPGGAGERAGRRSGRLGRPVGAVARPARRLRRAGGAAGHDRARHQRAPGRDRPPGGGRRPRVTRG